MIINWFRDYSAPQSSITGSGAGGPHLMSHAGKASLGDYN